MLGGHGDLLGLCPPSHTVMALSHGSFHSLLGLATSPGPVGLTRQAVAIVVSPTVDAQVTLWCYLAAMSS